MQKLSCLTILIVLISFGAAVAGPPGSGGDNEPGRSGPDEILFEIEAEYDLWLEATVAGHDGEANRFEKNLLGLVSHDILVTQERVRSMAKSRALGSRDDNPAETVDRREFQIAIQYLNTKEALYRSLNRTHAFSNRYRLLGDYIDLLRRELKMPRLKLAETGKPAAGDESGPGASADKK